MCRIEEAAMVAVEHRRISVLERLFCPDKVLCFGGTKGRSCGGEHCKGFRD